MNTVAKRRPWFGIGGNIVGVLAVVAAVLPMWVLPVIAPSPPIDKIVVDTAGKIKDRVVTKLKGVPYKEAERKIDSYRVSAIVAGSLGVCALSLAVVSFLVDEPRRYVATAAMLGAGAIAFQFLSQAITSALGVIAIVIVLLAMFN